jgi:hypothetical protein
MEIAAWEDSLPFIGDEDLIYTLQGGVRSFVAPRIELILQMNLLQHSVIEEAMELAHTPVV